ncbi:hypothetical protein EG327_003860 [Venturia inaequalis]|uniref:Uncharacterized protein n=1 Tax=Venturia inaequalis TaxID=5025 RepID=A0A8H3VI19_VENIN|nr:hypothetical protein EG327_003860 [Venturia inaequalis]
MSKSHSRAIPHTKSGDLQAEDSCLLEYGATASGAAVTNTVPAATNLVDYGPEHVDQFLPSLSRNTALQLDSVSEQMRPSGRSLPADSSEVDNSEIVQLDRHQNTIRSTPGTTIRQQAKRKGTKEASLPTVKKPRTSGTDVIKICDLCDTNGERGLTQYQGHNCARQAHGSREEVQDDVKAGESGSDSHTNTEHAGDKYRSEQSLGVGASGTADADLTGYGDTDETSRDSFHRGFMGEIRTLLPSPTSSRAVFGRGKYNVPMY